MKIFMIKKMIFSTLIMGSNILFAQGDKPAIPVPLPIENSPSSSTAEKEREQIIKANQAAAAGALESYKKTMASDPAGRVEKDQKKSTTAELKNETAAVSGWRGNNTKEEAPKTDAKEGAKEIAPSTLSSLSAGYSGNIRRVRVEDQKK